MTTDRGDAADAPAWRTRYHRVIGEVLRFGAVGGVAFVTDVAVFNLLLHTLGKPLSSKIISVVVATTVSYFINRHWTFKDRARSGVRREYVLFFVLNGIGAGIALVCLAISHYVLDLTSPLADNVSANGLGLLLGTAFRFWSYRRFVFLDAEPVPDAARDLARDAG